jgi:hypothetical protein
MVVRVFVVPEHGSDRGGDSLPDRPQDHVEPINIVSICGVSREQEQINRLEAVQVRREGREVLVPMNVSDRGDSHPVVERMSRR